MDWDRLVARGENSSLDEFYQETVSAGQQTREIRMRTRDKRIIPVELNCARLPDERWCVSIRDIAERRRLQDELRQNEARFRDFSNSSADWFWETDADYRFTWVSDNIYDIVGVPTGSLLGRSRLDLLARSTANSPALIEAHRELLARRQPFRHFQNAPGSQIVFGRPFFLGPPGIPQPVAHGAEIFRRLDAGRAARLVAEYLPDAVRNHVQDNQRIRKIECRVARIQGLQEAASRIEFLAELLAAPDGAVTALSDVSRAAGKTNTLVGRMSGSFAFDQHVVL